MIKKIESNNKKKYLDFCDTTFVPIFSKPWWMDAICGINNWDVWLLENNGRIDAAMPYYFTTRGNYRYITKAKLTQNNGIIFNYPETNKLATRYAFEEQVINKACEFINEMNLDVYEQQYHYSFKNWLPFYWNNYSAIPRYTFVLEKEKTIEEIWEGITSQTRSAIRKGKRLTYIDYNINPEQFFEEHEKVFLKQGMNSPITYSEWIRLYTTCNYNNCGQLICAREKETNAIASIIFLVWDEHSVYHLLGGSVPELQNLDSYASLIWEGIKFSLAKGLSYDFEGSVIKRIAKSIREFGGTPNCYFRIRKVFNPNIVKAESEFIIKSLHGENDESGI